MVENFDQNGKLICVGGFPASGKTRVACLIAERLAPDAVIIDPDIIWCGLLGSLSDRPLQSSDISIEVSIMVLEMARERSVIALREGKTVIVPNAFMIDVQRTSFETLARDQNVKFYPLWLMTTTEITVQRAVERKCKWDAGIREPYNMSIVDAYLGDPISSQQAVAPNWTRIDAGQEPKLVADQIFKILSGQNAATVGSFLHDIPRNDLGSSQVEFIH